MKQYTTPEQTTKLIELGFEKPKNERWVLDVANESTPSIQNIVKCQDYPIGELIEMLPKEMDCELGDLGLSIENNIYETPNEWIVFYDGRHQTNSVELVDALYAMILQLKEEGVI
jgi:hypothetical protein